MQKHKGRCFFLVQLDSNGIKIDNKPCVFEGYV